MARESMASSGGIPSARRVADHHQHHLESLDRLQGVGHVCRHQDHLIFAEAVGYAADRYFGVSGLSRAPSLRPQV
jgi:hypothetical protein